MKNDMRVIRTKKALKKGLIDLLKEETFEKINVSKICEKAYVNRVTFYLHYQDKYDLFQSIIEDLKEEIIHSASDSLPNKEPTFQNISQYFISISDSIIKIVYENKEILVKFGNQENNMLLYMIQNSAEHYLEKLFDKLENHIQFKYKRKYVISLIVGGTSKAIMDWIINDSMEDYQTFRKETAVFLNDLANSQVLFTKK